MTTEKELTPYQIKNPFTLKWYEGIITFFQDEISALTQRTIALLSISIAIIAAPFFITFLQAGKLSTICFESALIYSLFLICSIITSIISIVFLFWTGLIYLKAIGPGGAYKMDIPGTDSIKECYQEDHEFELYKLNRMTKLIDELLNFYNKKLDTYSSGIRKTKISVKILLVSIILTVVSSIL